MQDSVRVAEISTKELIQAIVGIATDNRHHGIWEDECRWLEKKMQAIKRIAKELARRERKRKR